MKLSSRVLCLAFVLPLFSACGPLPAEPTSELKVDFDIPKDDIDPADIEELLGGIGSFVQQGSHLVTLTDLVERINVEGGFKSTLLDIVATRDKQASVDCTGRKCRIITTGRDFTFKLDSVSIPVLGSPTIMLERRIEIFAELSEDEQRFNACSITGVKVKTGFLTPNVDGTLIELDGNQIKTLSIDAGPAGNYPNRSCQ